MRKLIFSIDSNAKTCGKCFYLSGGGSQCGLFLNQQLSLDSKTSKPLRHDTCLKAEHVESGPIFGIALKATYGQLRDFLIDLGFTRERVRGSHTLWTYSESPVTILLRSGRSDTKVSSAVLTSIRANLRANGFKL